MTAFHSSDYEDAEPAHPDPYPYAGSKSIEAMLETQFKGRIKYGQPQRHRWSAYVHYVPTGDNIARFIETISAKCIPSYRDKPAVSLTSIRNAVLNVYARLQFKHKLLNFSRHNFKRIDTVLDRLVKEGKLTPGRWRKRQRAGVALVRLLGQAWFTDCLTHGCRSWDVTISRFLSISLMAATAGRAGDIVRSKGYTGLEYLRWEHVELVLGGHDDGQSPTIQGMTASITMK